MWLQMAGYQWIWVGSGRDTSRVACWCHLDPPKLPPGGSEWSEIARKCYLTKAILAMSSTGCSKWMDLSESWLDLGGIYPGWSVGVIWTHQNSPRGALGVQK